MKETVLESVLRRRLKTGRVLVPYLTAGIPSASGFKELIQATAPFADAIEVGIPFSDPIMDGPVIQAASARAIETGVTPDVTLELIGELSGAVSCPIVVMTYFNPVLRKGLERFVADAADAGVSGVIVPDLPLEESHELSDALASRSMAFIQMVAPTTTAQRAARLAKASTGFVYAVSRMGVTGEQSVLSTAAHEVVAKVRPFARVPILIGIGVSTADHAREATRSADGVIVGSAVMKRAMDADVEGLIDLLTGIREAI